MTYFRAANDFLLSVKVGLDLGDRPDRAIRIAWIMRGVR